MCDSSFTYSQIHNMSSFNTYKMSLKLQVYTLHTECVCENDMRCGFYFPYWNDNTAASCVWQMYFFQSGVGLKEVIRRYRPTAHTLQHLGKVKQFSWVWLRRRAVQLESCGRGSSAFCRVVEPRPQFSKLLYPCKLFLSLFKCQICFQWNNSGSFPP